MKTRCPIIPLLLVVSGWGSFSSPASQSAVSIDRVQSAALDGEKSDADQKAPSHKAERNLPRSAGAQAKGGDKEAKPGDKDAQHIITLEDDGHTLAVAVGERLLLKLGGDWDWTLDAYDTAMLRPVRARAPLPKGSQALLEAVRAGDTTLSLTGDPPCLKSRPPCALQSRSFRMTVKVR